MAKKICPSDFKHKILIQSRELLPDNTSVDFHLNFIDGVNAWASIQTTRGREYVGQVNTETGNTHIFIMRYIPNITSQHWILYKEKRYDVADVENIDENNRYLRLRCNERGTKDLNRNSW